jgi:2-methylisocitrate lyase-like PEP mutase family enzyme
MRDLKADAEKLRSLHGQPLVLANVWDAATAKVVEGLGFPAVATSSAAVALSRGVDDTDSMDPDVAFGAVAVVAQAVSVPVTADLEAGYQLPADEFVGRLLEAGAVGCNLEDTDHHGDNPLVPVDVHTERVAAVKEAGRAAGVDIVVNARCDAFARRVDSPLEESLRRGRAYLDAGADCVYPIVAWAEDDIKRLVDELGPINIWLGKESPPVARLTELGVARISVGSGLYRWMLGSFKAAATRVRDGDPKWWEYN